VDTELFYLKLKNGPNDQLAYTQGCLIELAKIKLENLTYYKNNNI